MSGAGLAVELLLKSGLIAGAGLTLAWALGFRPAADRVDILRATVCLLILLPLGMAAAPGLSVALLPPPETAVALPAPAVWAGAVEPVEGVALYGSILRPSAADLALWAWAVGALLVLGRFGLGVWTLRRWTRRGRSVTAAAWTAPLERLTPARRPRLVASPAVGAPLSWGTPPGVVLIGEDHLARPETARAVMAHELAHLQRGDWVFLVLSRIALGLFWFNPLVWRLHAALSARSEEAADAVALGEVGPQDYARALVGLAADFNPPAALGMAGPAATLTRRIACIMKTSVPLRPRPLAMALAVGALVAVATPIAALELTPRAPVARHAEGASTAPAGTVAPVPSVAAVRPVDAVAPTAGLMSAVGWRAAQDAPAPPPPPPLPRHPSPPAPPAPYGVAPPAPPPPPAPPAPPALPAPPPPPPPPAHAPRAGWAQSGRPLTAQERQAVEEARQAAVEARIEAAGARRQATAARAQARVNAATAAEARIHARVAVAEAARGRAMAGQAREAAMRDVANARANMAEGAEQMLAGAEQMREESARLRDPAYRAEQMERARGRGETVTDAELRALSPRLATQADALEARAVQLRERAARQAS